MKCQKCSSEMSLVYGMDHYHCAACNTFEFPTDLQNSSDGIVRSGRKTDFLCPVCPDSNLEIGELRGSEVCFCSNCRGYVIDSLTLGSMISALRAAFQGPDDRPILINRSELGVTIKCPACLERMDTHPYHGPGTVVIDSCMQCKLSWMGYGELAKIIRAPGIRE